MDSELFSGESFHDFGEGTKRSAISAIHNCELERISNSSTEELVKHFEDEFLVQPLTIKEDERYQPSEPFEKNISSQERDAIFDRQVVVDRSYVSFTIHVPFQGSGSLFGVCPSSRMRNMSRVMEVLVRGGELRFSYEVLVPKSGSISDVDMASEHKQDMKIILQNVQNLNVDIEKLNTQLTDIIKTRLEEKQKTVSASKSLIQSLDIPIKKRGNVPNTYRIPEIQKKTKVEEAKKIDGQKPVPTLSVPEYENILSIMKDMALAMERTPATFAKLTEEEIRDFFLILLNGRYEGMATGETFNGKGKTDILIRYKNANAFIAECKFWKGEKSLEDAIQQLFGYVTWRDTKTSLVIFSKNKNFSTVVKKQVRYLKDTNFSKQRALLRVMASRVWAQYLGMYLDILKTKIEIYIFQ